MKYLGIDYGRRKIGLAVSEGIIAEPYKVIRYDNQEELVNKVEQVIKVELVERVVLGISEGNMGKETEEFAKKLESRIKTPVVLQDETLSTQSAQELSQSAGIKRKKRKEMEDAYSAAIILQDYIDNNL
jgi:putative holliday junction resolvase